MRCRTLCYGVLGGVSTGYPPDTGKLLTRYAPLRRSPSKKYCYSLTLPLDLHVLSLPLAFILSQDQTLHCIINYLFSPILNPSVLLYKRINASRVLNFCYKILVRYLLVLVTSYRYDVPSVLSMSFSKNSPDEPPPK